MVLRHARMGTCSHVAQIHEVTPHSTGCEDCLKLGDTWMHLRLCLSCGHVGCCDSSKNKHATKHFHSAHHPVVKSSPARAVREFLESTYEAGATLGRWDRASLERPGVLSPVPANR